MVGGERGEAERFRGAAPRGLGGTPPQRISCPGLPAVREITGILAGRRLRPTANTSWRSTSSLSPTFLIISFIITVGWGKEREVRDRQGRC